MNHKPKVLIEGVCRKGKRGLTKMVRQEEVKGKEKIAATVRTVKAAMLNCQETSNNTIVAASVYETKLVHSLSLLTEEVKCIEKTRKLLNKDHQKHEFCSLMIKYN